MIRRTVAAMLPAWALAGSPPAFATSPTAAAAAPMSMFGQPVMPPYFSHTAFLDEQMQRLAGMSSMNIRHILNPSGHWNGFSNFPGSWPGSSFPPR
jgi:hypothetical protein